jgi:hypothetical protein
LNSDGGIVHESVLILTLTFSLSAALVLGFLTQRAGLSPIVGYLLAGLIVGPYTPGFVADGALAEQFAEIGVILLMFGAGRDRRVRPDRSDCDTPHERPWHTSGHHRDQSGYGPPAAPRRA